MKKLHKKIYLILAIMLSFVHFVNAATSKVLNKIEPGTYVFISFSMNDESLRNYFLEAQPHQAKLIVIGLFGEKKSRNRFAIMKNKVEQAKINVEINPNLFEQLNIKQVPVIALVDKSGSVKKISGHISLNKALEIMQTEQK